MRKIIIIGGGGHTLSCEDVIHSTKKFSIAGIVLKDKKDTTKYNFNICYLWFSWYIYKNFSKEYKNIK